VENTDIYITSCGTYSYRWDLNVNERRWDNMRRWNNVYENGRSDHE